MKWFGSWLAASRPVLRDHRRPGRPLAVEALVGNSTNPVVISARGQSVVPAGSIKRDFTAREDV